MIVLMNGMLFRAFMGVLGLKSAIMSPTVEDCLRWASKKSLSVTFSMIMTKHFPGVFRSPAKHKDSIITNMTVKEFQLVESSFRIAG
jgi:hypothetical protein